MIHGGSSESDRGARARLIAPLSLSYLLGFGLIVALFHFGGVWSVLANTRLLDPLIQSGVIALTDADSGFITGVPDLDYYIASQDPVDWGLVVVAAGLLLMVMALKAIQFHGLARFCDSDGGPGFHARAYIYGHGTGRVVPFGAGDIAVATILESEDAPAHTAGQTVFGMRIFAVFEIVVFALVGLFASTVTTWANEIFWALVILGVAWFMLRPRLRASGPDEPGAVALAAQFIRAMATRPALLVTMGLLSLVSFLAIDASAYVLTQAFTAENVILNVDAGVILMGVVGAHAARMVAVTPGGIGQYEWGFAAAVYAGGVGFPEAVTVALLFSALRYLVGGVLFLATVLIHGPQAQLGSVMATLARSEPKPGRSAA